ncbi:MAG: 4Fe-4S dicluster domain-containing protein [Thermoplasmatales archaeon]|nr:4Fe-4S dicluster domain-containing protein [Thermoplasmatales archaeon]
MDVKYRLRFNEGNVHESVAYILVTKFDVVPNILKADVKEDGGVMILSMGGDSDNIVRAIEHLKGLGISIKTLDKYIDMDPELCIDCGACVSVCPTKSFKFNPETWEIELAMETCVACGACLTACPTHALEIQL